MYSSLSLNVVVQTVVHIDEKWHPITLSSWYYKKLCFIRQEETAFYLLNVS